MKLHTNAAALALAGILTMGLAACGSADAETADTADAPQTVATPAHASGAGMSDASPADANPETLHVYKTATCGCCGKWVEHMEAHGFDVAVHEMSQAELADVKAKKGIGSELQSCHTAEIGGYLVEGHVPADDLKRLLKQKPDGVKGIAVPGMPIGSPGMEMEDRPAEAYDVVTFDAAGETEVFASH